MIRSIAALFVIAASALSMSACSEQAPGTSQAAKAVPKSQPVSIQAINRHAQGFKVASAVSARTVYVFFDPQCLHCARQWMENKGLAGKANFQWIPVGLVNKSSLPQGAAILGSADPVKAMDEHETSMLARTGGISASSSSNEILQAIRTNTELLASFGVEGVPFIVSTNAQTGSLVTIPGAVSARDMAQLFGW